MQIIHTQILYYVFDREIELFYTSDLVDTRVHNAYILSTFVTGSGKRYQLGQKFEIELVVPCKRTLQKLSFEPNPAFIALLYYAQ